MDRALRAHVVSEILIQSLVVKRRIVLMVDVHCVTASSSTTYNLE